MRNTILIVSILSLIFLINPVHAVVIDITPSEAEAEVNGQAWYTIQINNNGFLSDEFVVTVLGPHLEWLNLESYYIRMNPFEKQDVKMFFYPSVESSYQYEVMVYSRNNNANKDLKAITLKVVPEKELKILSFTCTKSGSELEIDLKLSSKEKRTVKIPFDITDGEGKTIKHVEVTKEVSGVQDITEIVPVGELLAGDYYVKTNIPEFDVTGQTSFSIQPVHNIVTKKEVVSTPLGQQVIITVTNEGNVVEEYNVKESVQSNQYVDLVNSPTNVYVEGSDVNYNWKIEGLAVGKSVAVTYNISRLPIIGGSFIIVFCVVALLGMGAVKVRTPRINKRHVKKRGEHLIILEIKGAITSNLKNVMIKDRVSPLGKVVQEFGGPKPVVRESEAGTELIWNLGDVKPRSEIYLSYKIRPLIEAQLKMPRAYLSYRTGEEDTKIKVFSREVILE